LRVRWAAFGTYDRRRHPRVAVLIEGLRARGDEVVEINEPLRLDTAGRVAILRQPWRLPVFAGELARCWAVLLRRARRVDTPDAVLVGYLGHFDVWLARIVFRRTPIVLDHLISAGGTARDRGLAGSAGFKARVLRAIDSGALGRADVVVVDTAEHEAALPDQARAKAVVAPVGATDEWFAKGRVRAGGGGEGSLKVIFVGLFTPLHGTDTLGRAIALLADDNIEITIVGTGQEYAACRAAAMANTRVTWVDWVPPEDLPALVGAHDVSLGIFGTTAKALNVVPTKVYQGSAAGCAIVTSDTPPQRAALSDAAVLVPPGDPAALANAIRGLADSRSDLARLRSAAHARAVECFTPTAVTAALSKRAEELVLSADTH
jgi:glycosyltransferase involved in cell wall biosynthesis